MFPLGPGLNELSWAFKVTLKLFSKSSNEGTLRWQVARCTKIINADSEDAKYIINVKQFAKFVVDLAEQAKNFTIN